VKKSKEFFVTLDAAARMKPQAVGEPMLETGTCLMPRCSFQNFYQDQGPEVTPRKRKDDWVRTHDKKTKAHFPWWEKFRAKPEAEKRGQ